VPKPLPIQFREEKKLKRALDQLKPNSNFLNWVSEKLKSLLYLIKDIDRIVK
jgi:hypothetical protein